MKTGPIKLIDALLGIADGSWEERAKKCLLGILVPAVPIVYGLLCMLAEEAQFIGRYGIITLSGAAAMSAGAAYMAFGLFLHVHFVWDDHPQLGSLSDPARTLLLIVTGLSLTFTFVGVLL